MKMFDKNGNMTIMTKSIFDSNMVRLRAGEAPLEIANTLHEQCKLIEYNGYFVDDYNNPTIWYWQAFKQGQAFARRLTPTPIINAMEEELIKYISAYYRFPIHAKRSVPIVLQGSIVV